MPTHTHDASLPMVLRRMLDRIDRLEATVGDLRNDVQVLENANTALTARITGLEKA